MYQENALLLYGSMSKTTKEPKTVLLMAARVEDEINPYKNAREFRKIVRNSLAV